MQRGLSPLTTQLRRSARVQQSDANILSSEAGGADERRLVLALLAKSTEAPASRRASMSGSSLPFCSTPLNNMSETK